MVDLVGFTLVDSGAEVHVPRFAITSRNEHINSVDFVHSEFALNGHNSANSNFEFLFKIFSLIFFFKFLNFFTHVFVLLTLLLSWVLDDCLLAVDGVLLHLVRQHALDGLAAIGLGDL